MTDFTAPWGWPQWTMLVFMLLTLIITTANHGKPRTDFNGFIGLINFCLGIAILTAGGFFS